MDWTEFEIIVRWIYETLGRKLGVFVEGYGPRCKRVGKSGVAHQIDVLTSHSDGLHTYLTAIECKWWNEKVNKDIVMKVNSINADCNFDKSVIVTKIGFTEDAIKYASHTNVQLVELKEHNLQISGDTLVKFYMHHKISQPELLEVRLCSDAGTSAKYVDHPILQAYDRFVYTRKKESFDINQLINEFLNEKVLPLTHSEIVTYDRSFDKVAKLKSQTVRGSIPITGIQFRGFNRIYTRLDTDYFLNKSWMALKLVFEKKELMVTLHGDIEPWDNGEPIQAIVGRKFNFESYGNARKFKINKNFHLLTSRADPTGHKPIE